MKASTIEISQQFSEGNFPFCYDHFTNDIEWKIIGNKTLKGRENIIENCNSMMIEMASSTLKNFNMVVENNCVVIEGNCKFTNEDNTQGQVSYCDIFHFANDKISQITSYCI